jgi:hypothetical protein
LQNGLLIRVRFISNVLTNFAYAYTTLTLCLYFTRRGDLSNKEIGNLMEVSLRGEGASVMSTPYQYNIF